MLPSVGSETSQLLRTSARKNGKQEWEQEAILYLETILIIPLKKNTLKIQIN